MGAQQLPGSHLLAALHAGMERIKTCLKVSRAASKKPQNRSNLDINYIAAETQLVQHLTQHGSDVHRDLCHVLQHCHLSQMSSFRLPGDHPAGLFIYVMQGRVQVRTRQQYTSALDLAASSGHGESDKTAAGGSTTQSGRSGPGETESSSTSAPGGVSEADLRALFDSIDCDHSCAIDVEELQYALEVMGLNKTAAEVQELMDSVDADGSGELEFDEFVLILTTKLGVGQQQQSTWQELPEGAWALEVGHGCSLGAAALANGLAQEGLILALEDSDLLLLDGTTYSNILSTGFDGQLTAKMSMLRNCPVLSSSLSSRSDLRGLAYVAAAETYCWGSRLYAAGQSCQPGLLFIITEGQCRIVGKVKGPNISPVAAPAAPLAATAARGACKSTGARLSGAGTAASDAADPLATCDGARLLSPKRCLKSPRSRVADQQVELAVVASGDFLGEAVLLGLTTHASSAVVSSAHLSVLKLQLTDLQQLMHPADLQVLEKTLRQRDSERSQRLAAAAATARTLHVQQQQLTSRARGEPAPTRGSELQAQHTGQGSPRPAQGCGSGSGSSNGGRWLDAGCTGDAAAAAGSTSEEAGMRLLQLSSGASAAAAIAAVSSDPGASLPSRVARAEADAVAQLLTGLVGVKEDMQAAHAAAIATTAAALAAAGRPAAQAALPLAVAPIHSSSMGARSAVGGIMQAFSSCPGAELRKCSSLQYGSEAACQLWLSAPGAAAGVAGFHQPQQQQQHLTAMHTLLPDRLVVKLHQATCLSTPGQQHSTPHHRHRHSSQAPSQTAAGSHAAISSSRKLHRHACSTAGTSSHGRGCRQAPHQHSTLHGSDCCCITSTAGSTAGAPAATAACRDDATKLGCVASRPHGVSSAIDMHLNDPHQHLQPDITLHRDPRSFQGDNQGSPAACMASTNCPDAYFLQTRDAGSGYANLQLQQPVLQQQRVSSSNRSSLVSARLTQPGVHGFVSSCGQQHTPVSPMQRIPLLNALPVAASGAVAVAAAHQQLASGSITLPTPRSNRARSQGAGAVAVVALALTAEAAAATAASSDPGQQSSSTAAWPGISPRHSAAPGRRREAGAAAGCSGLSSRHSSSWPLKATQGLDGSCSSPRGSSVGRLLASFTGSSCGGRLSSAGAPGAQCGAQAMTQAACGSPQQAGLAVSAAGPLSGREKTVVGSSANGNTARVQPARASATAAAAVAGVSPTLHCSPARPVPGGVFVELDGAAWEVAQGAADAASWCLSSRSRQHLGQPQCLEGAVAHQQLPVLQSEHDVLQHVRQQQHMDVQGPTQPIHAAAALEGATAAAATGQGVGSTAALITAAQQLLSQPLPPCCSDSCCRPADAVQSPSGQQLGGSLCLHNDQGTPLQLGHVPGDASRPDPTCSPTATNTRLQAKAAGMRGCVRPSSVPQLQLTKLQVSLAQGCSSPHSPAVSNSAAKGSSSSTLEPSSCSCLLDSWQDHMVVLPPALPAFTPRRVWVPGGSHSARGEGGAAAGCAPPVKP